MRFRRLSERNSTEPIRLVSGVPPWLSQSLFDWLQPTLLERQTDQWGMTFVAPSPERIKRMARECRLALNFSTQDAML